MKKRRTLIISLLLVAALALGIGYAAMSTELSITGTAHSNATTNVLNVNFTASEKDTSSIADPLTTATTVNNTAKQATFSVEKMAQGDKVTFTYTVTNEAGAGIGAILREEPTPTYTLNIGEGTAETVSDKTEIAKYIKIDVKYYEADGTTPWVAGDSGTILGNGESMKVVVTVEQVAPLVKLLTINDFVLTMDWDGDYDMT